MALLYYVLHLPVIPAWLLLILAPGARATRAYVHSGVVPVMLGPVYAVFLFCGAVLGFSAEGAGMGSLEGVTALFSHPVGVLTGWAHFIVFDLFVGAWIARDAARLGMGHSASVPILILTLVFGPLGLVAHILRRVAGGHGWRIG
ncbi:DUF4281 domain-containing protein [Pararhodobacter marinus]|uniref:DUF4281 domain-containing protein n=1 Tax=Pararhodobacter marinus TaxID=2184063 RepID=A0A2U2C8T4_9RHOB|nr:ABA4-like family protein [Pararhodobacter marinus]PWE28273.1 DUF4281 domain-containing protein [Pararhodobacter marinus]